MLVARRSAVPLAVFSVSAWAGLGQPPVATAQNPLGGEFQVNSYTTESQDFPEVARNADGEFLVVWESDYPPFSLLGQGYDAAGEPIGSEFRVNPIGKFGGAPSIAADPDGNFIVVYVSNTGVVGQKYDPSGTPLGALFGVFGLFPF